MAPALLMAVIWDAIIQFQFQIVILRDVFAVIEIILADTAAMACIRIRLARWSVGILRATNLTVKSMDAFGKIPAIASQR
jgi:hypothetical protein